MPKKKKSNAWNIFWPIAVLMLAALIVFVIDTFGVAVVSQLKSFFSFMFYTYLVGSILVVFFEEQNPERMMAWLLILILFPGFGLVAYLAFGRSFRKQRRVKQKKVEGYPRWIETMNKNIQLTQKETIKPIPDISKTLIQLLKNNSGAHLLLHNEIKVMSDGVITFALMLEALEKAEHVINLEFFIVKNDELGNRFRKTLIKKASEGVEVNFLYDAVGSWRLGHHYKETLENAGVNVKAFLPVIAPFVSRNMNYRNHRKILTIDGKVGFVGGLNIGDEYLGKKEQFGYWRDTHLMIKGEGVYALNHIFLDDWRFSGGEIESYEKYFPKLDIEQRTLMQIASSGPDSDKQVIKQAYFKMIASAKKSVYIESPYLVPEESLMVALKTAALSGVDVKIVIPYIADHFMVYWANQSNIQQLLESNVKVYYYKGGFIHAKTLLVDDVCASVGTANLDIRSMELNFEVNAFIYDDDVIRDLRNDFEEDLYRSEEILLEEFKKRKAYRKVLEAFGRLVSPLQ